MELGKVLLYQGRYQDVVALLDTALPPGASHENALRRNLLLARARNGLGEEKLANDALARAKALHPEGILQAEMEGVEGAINVDRGNLGAAEPLLQLALSAAQQSKEEAFLQVRLWNNLGVVALKQSHYEDARTRFNHASTIAQTIGARVALNYALDNLASLYYQTGDFSRALQNAQLAAAQAAKGGAALDEAQALTNAGMIQSQTGDPVAALSSYQRALALAERLQNPEKLGNIHAAMAYLLVRSDPRSAEDHIREAVRIAGSRKDSLEEQLEAAFLEGLLQVERGESSEAEAKLLAVERRSADSPWLRWKTQNTLAELYADRKQGRKAEAWFERAIDTFHHNSSSVDSVEMQLPFFENGSDLYLSYMEYLIRQGRTDDALMVLDRSRAEMLAQGLHQAARGGDRRARGSSARLLAARLQGTILVYCLRPEHSYLWAINAKREEFHELAGRETVLPLVERHTQAILASKDLLGQKDLTGAALYEALVRPAEGLLQPGGRVFLIADKDLSGLNFETLIPPGAQPHYWIEDETVSNARSLRLLGTVGQHTGGHTAGKMLLIGDPVYRAEEYAPLPNAAAEMTGVASHFASADREVYSGAAASPASYNGSVAKGFAYLHFVAHATADETNPLDSAIILSHAAGGGSPYKLYAGEILKQPLEAELVTLSSCYGSGVRNYSGEGVVGLVWAFLRAGAHAVIGAMWEVSDVSTPQLMDRMYGELLRGNQPDAALRSAKLVMVHDRGVFRKPLYWGAFQLYTGR